jgi:outer membrane protein assembly factor BamD
MRLYSLLIILSALLVTSCGEYEKLLKSSDYELKKDKAIEYYEAGKYIKATELLGQVLPRYRASEEAERLSWLNARSFYELQDYMMAGTYFSNFSLTFPFSRYEEEAVFMAAYCDYKMSPRPQLDQEYTRKAIEGFNLFRRRFPASTRLAEADKIIMELEEKLVEKSYLSARLYYDMGQCRAATVALNNSLNEYPDTKFREEMMYLKLSAHMLYAEYSVSDKKLERYQDAYDDYLSFVEEYPEGRYDKEVKKIHDTLLRILKPGDSKIDIENR